MAEESLSILTHGPAGSGKTTLGLTGPKPLVFLDAETASRFIPKSYRKITWNPMEDGLAPVYDGSWDICVVKIKNWEVLQKIVSILATHRHPFRTVVIDSVSEILIKAKQSINGEKQFQIQHWGQLGSKMGSFLRTLRDITADEGSSIEILNIISATKDFNVGTEDKPHMEKRPLLEGSVKDTIQYLYDIIAYIELDEVAVNPANPGQGMRKQQRIFTGSDPHISSKARPPGIPPELFDIDLSTLLAGVYGSEEENVEPEPEVDKDGVIKDNNTKATKSSGLPSLPTK